MTEKVFRNIKELRFPTAGQFEIADPDPSSEPRFPDLLTAEVPVCTATQ